MIHFDSQVYWFGDMNYRLNNLTLDQIHSFLRSKDYSFLMLQDQMLIEKKRGNCFQNYHEGVINFPPTYKYDVNSDNFDSSEKKRSPAWCDRVLWTEKDGQKENHIKLVAYRSHPECKASDHKPVSALFHSSFRIVDIEKKKKVYEDVMKKLDKEENDYLPQVSLDSTEVKFGKITFKDAPSRTITLVNTGQSNIRFSFINKLSDTTFCKDWLRVTPSSGQIRIKHQATITFELNFDDPMWASKFNYGIEELFDTLVLSLRGGKDIFITVSAEYRPTCFGCSLETLTRMDKPVSFFTVQELRKQFYPDCYQLATPAARTAKMQISLPDPSQYIQPTASTESSQSGQQSLLLEFDPILAPRSISPVISPFVDPTNVQFKSKCTVPKELFMILDFLFKNNGLFTLNLFRDSPLLSELVFVRDSLDNCVPLGIQTASISAVAGALLLFLQTLPEPVVPYAFYGKVTKSQNSFSHCKQVWFQFDAAHFDRFPFPDLQRDVWNTSASIPVHCPFPEGTVQVRCAQWFRRVCDWWVLVVCSLLARTNLAVLLYSQNIWSTSRAKANQRVIYRPIEGRWLRQRCYSFELPVRLVHVLHARPIIFIIDVARRDQSIPFECRTMFCLLILEEWFLMLHTIISVLTM